MNVEPRLQYKAENKQTGTNTEFFGGEVGLVRDIFGCKEPRIQETWKPRKQARRQNRNNILYTCKVRNRRIGENEWKDSRYWCKEV